MTMYLLNRIASVTTPRIDPRASLFVIFVLLLYIMFYDRFLSLPKKDKYKL